MGDTRGVELGVDGNDWEGVNDTEVEPLSGALEEGQGEPDMVSMAVALVEKEIVVVMLGEELTEIEALLEGGLEGVKVTVVDTRGEALIDTETDILKDGEGVGGFDVTKGEGEVLMQGVDEREGDELDEAVGGLEVTTGVNVRVVDTEGDMLIDMAPDILKDEVGVGGFDVTTGEIVAVVEEVVEKEKDELGVAVGGLEVTTGVKVTVVDSEGETLGKAEFDTLTEIVGVKGLDVATGVALAVVESVGG